MIHHLQNVSSRIMKESGANSDTKSLVTPSLSNRKSSKDKGFSKFCEMCNMEFSTQFPTQPLDDNELKKKCTQRWKDMTKKEKKHFEIS